ncbi:hypothetical protein TWF128_007794 [Orbilia oligospora]|nr:hypothetical protein TWF128_007794 [Orbilia oligospora]
MAGGATRQTVDNAKSITQEVIPFARLVQLSQSHLTAGLAMVPSPISINTGGRIGAFLDNAAKLLLWNIIGEGTNFVTMRWRHPENFGKMNTSWNRSNWLPRNSKIDK